MILKNKLSFTDHLITHYAAVLKMSNLLTFMFIRICVIEKLMQLQATRMQIPSSFRSLSKQRCTFLLIKDSFYF